MRISILFLMTALLAPAVSAQVPNPSQSISPTVDTSGFYRDTAPDSPRKENRPAAQSLPNFGFSPAQKGALKKQADSLRVERAQAQKSSVEEVARAKQKKAQAPSPAPASPKMAGVDEFVKPPAPKPIALTAKEKQAAEERGAKNFDNSKSGKRLREIESQLSANAAPKNVLPKF